MFNISNFSPILDDTVLIQATIFNLGNLPAQQVRIRLYEQYRNNPKPIAEYLNW
jgi:hypothetical protein